MDTSITKGVMKKDTPVRLNRTLWDGDCKMEEGLEGLIVAALPRLRDVQFYWVRFKSHTHCDEQTGQYGPGGPYQAEIRQRDLEEVAG
jgi:CelD/BcsL family acetyltransferase involved in cellulose biosynthesis